jgi:hypothetical protein
MQATKAGESAESKKHETGDIILRQALRSWKWCHLLIILKNKETQLEKQEEITRAL